MKAIARKVWAPVVASALLVVLVACEPPGTGERKPNGTFEFTVEPSPSMSPWSKR